MSFLTSLRSDTRVARYMSFEKFFYLMEFGYAFFPNIRGLRNVNGNEGDPLEGRWSPCDLLLRNGGAEILDLAMDYLWPSVEKSENSKKDILRKEDSYQSLFGERPKSGYSKDVERMASWVDIWCWNRFDHERVDMWRAYGAGAGSVMMLSTVDRLKDSLILPVDHEIVLEDVKYVDKSSAIHDIKGNATVFLQKSRAFESEKEVRAILYNPNVDIERETSRTGQAIQVDLSRLVENVVMHYQSPLWMMDAINRISEEAIGKSAMESSIRKEIADATVFAGI